MFLGLMFQIALIITAIIELVVGIFFFVVGFKYTKDGNYENTLKSLFAGQICLIVGLLYLAILLDLANKGVIALWR